MILIILIMALVVFSILVGTAVRRKSRAAMLVAAILGSVAFVGTMLAAVLTIAFWGDAEYHPLPLVRAGSAFLHDFANVQALDSDGNVVEFSTMSSDYHVTVVGDLVDVQVEQRFFNPSDSTLNATYMFPLNSNAAVYAMEYVVGDEVIVAKIQTKKQATQTFEVAKKEGKSAALLVQERPNIFTQSLANIPPSTPVTIRIRYVHHAERRDGEYVVNLPTRVGRRYVPADLSGNTLGGQTFDASTAALPQGMLSFRGTVSAGLNVGSFLSPTHPITSRRLGTTGFSFESGTHLPNDDFEVRWTLAGANPSASVTATYDAATDTTYFSALIEPPAKVVTEDLRPREIVFVLDCSGSMSGPPINASRAFMHEALDGLRANDTFRVIRFSDRATEFSENVLLANADNISRGHAYIEELNSEGGTEMTAGIRQALAPPIEAGRLRIVVFLTDGYVGNDFEVIQLVDELRGEARMYSIGVGGSVNRFILDEVAKMGRGRSEYLETSPGMDAQARSLALRIAAPVLTNVTLDLRDANVLDIYPKELPDLFQGQAVRAIGRIQGKWSGQGVVRGMAVAGRVDVPVQTSVSADEAGLVGRTWARQRIGELNHQMLTSSDDHSALVAEVTEIGLGWSLMTQWTAFVAVSNKPAAVPDAQANTWFEPDVHGTPEPSMLLTGLMAAGAAFASRRRRRKEAADIE